MLRAPIGVQVRLEVVKEERIAGIRCHLEHCVALTPVFIVVTVCMALVISLADVFNPLAAPRIRRRAAVRPLWQHHAVEGAQVTRRVRSRRVEVLVGRQAAGVGQGKGRLAALVGRLDVEKEGRVAVL